MDRKLSKFMGLLMTIVMVASAFAALMPTAGAAPAVMNTGSRDSEPSNDQIGSAEAIASGVPVSGSIMVNPANDYLDWYGITCARGQAINVSMYHVDYDVADTGRYNLQLFLFGPESEGSNMYVVNWFSALKTRWETATTLCTYSAPYFVVVVTNTTSGGDPSSQPTHYTLDVTVNNPPAIAGGQSDQKTLKIDGPSWFQWYKITTPKDIEFVAKVTSPANGNIDMDMYGIWMRGWDSAAGNQSLQPWFLNQTRINQKGNVEQMNGNTGDMDVYVRLWLREGTGLSTYKFEVVSTMLPNDKNNVPTDAVEITKTTSILSHAQQAVDKFDWYKFTIDSGFTVDITFSLELIKTSYWNLTIWDSNLEYVAGWFNTKDGHPYIAPDTGSGDPGNPISSAGITLVDWAPPSAGTYYISIMPFASDPQNHMTDPPLVDQDYRLYLNLPNFGPTNKSQIPDAEIMEDQTFSGLDLADYFSDPEGDALSWNAKGDNKNVVVTIKGSNVTAKPAADWSGTCNITVEATDGTANIGANTVKQIVLLTVNSVNDVPYIKEAFVNFSMYEGEKDRQTYPYTLTAVFGDIDSALTYTYTGSMHIKVRIDQITKNVYFSADDLWYGEENITFTAKDDGTVPAKVTVNIKAVHKNHGPTLIGDKERYTIELDEDDEGDYSLNVKSMFDDIDLTYAGDQLVYRLKDPLPLHLNLTIMDDYTLVIIPEADWSGDSEFVVYAEDSIGVTNETTIAVKVEPVNDAPVINVFQPTDLELTMNEGDTKAFAITSITDIDNDTKYDIRYTWYVNNELQTGDNVRNHQYTFRTTYQEEDGYAEGTYHVKCVVSDGLASVEKEWTVEVVDVNQPPTGAKINLPQAGVKYTQGKALTFDADAGATDPDGDSLTFKWVINQTGTELSSQRAFSYDWKNKAINKELKPGTHKIDLIVSDSRGGEARTSVVVTIKAKPGGGGGFIPGFETVVMFGAVLVAAIALGMRRFKPN